MNQRIKELIKQADEKFSCEYNGDYTVFNKEKFAELIVKECADLVDGYTYPVQTQSHTIYHIASETIKEHFGVEE